MPTGDAPLPDALEFAHREFVRYSEMYAFWMRQASTSMPLANAAGATAVLSYVSTKDYSQAALGEVWAPLVIFVLGVVLGTGVVILRIADTLRRRRIALAHLKELMAGDTPITASTIMSSTTLDWRSLVLIASSGVLFLAGTVSGLWALARMVRWA